MLVLDERPREAAVVPLGITRRTADVLVDILAEAGVEVVFGIPGGTIAPVLDALLDRSNIRFVTTKHESGAMFAAAAYARQTQRLGVVAVTSGPGILNAITGLASAHCDGLPVVLLAGEVAHSLHGRIALQEGSSHHLNIVGITSHVAKLALEIPTSTAAPVLMRRAIATALSGKKGPVVVTVPIDLAVQATRATASSGCAHTEFSLDEGTLCQAASVLQTGRAVVFAGSGVRWDDGPTQLLQFAEQTHIPVMTSPKGKGVFPENHPLSLGVFGLGGHPSADAYLEGGLDTMLAVGTSLGELATHAWCAKLLPRRALIHIDIEAFDVARNYPVDISITAKASDALRELTARVGVNSNNHGGGIRYHADAETATSNSIAISPPRALWEIQQSLPANAVYCIDAGEHSVFATHYLRINEPDAFIAMIGLGSMGSSFGAAIGAQLAQPKRTVCVICGDGGYALAASELSTAAAEKLPIRVFVLNDQRLGMVERGNMATYGRTPHYPIRSLEISRHAQSIGCMGVVCFRPGDILSTIPLLASECRPVVVDVRIDPNVAMPRNERFAQFAATVKGHRSIRGNPSA